MYITEDASCVDKFLVERGFATIKPFSVNLDRYYTDTEMAENRRCAESLSPEEWEKRCDSERERIGANIQGVCNMLSEKYILGQYRRNFSKEYDLWFWCNVLYDSTGRRIIGRDMSYVQLTLNKDMETEKKEKMWDELRSILAPYEARNVQAIFKVVSRNNETALAVYADRIYRENEGKFLHFHGAEGKLFRYDEGHYAFRYRGKKKMIHLEPVDIARGM